MSNAPPRAHRLATTFALLAGPVLVGVWGALQFGSPSALGIAFLAAALGPAVGLFSQAPFFTASFKLALAAALCLAVTLVVVGLRSRHRRSGIVAVAAGSLLWTCAGGVGFGPQ